MGVLDKLKNALFEEEYVEVEEKPKTKPKRERKRKEKKNKVDTAPIAKKVVLPEKKEEEPKEVDPVEEKPLDEDFDVEPLKQNTDKFTFPMVEDTDFDNTDDYSIEKEEYKEPEIVKVVEPEEDFNSYKEEKHLYGIDESDRINVSDYGSYEVEKKIFRPSPIISPIYGVLDKNYKKEEIVNKKEVRLTSSYAREHLSVDDVRNKAYGVSDEEPKIISTENKKETDKEEDLMVDLTSDDDKPNVKEVTVGDAEEYFEDLGLEYNIDYKDASKEKATGRRSDKNKEESKEEVQEEVKEEKKTTKKKEVVEEKADDNDDNLFDLIDSMYDEDQE